MSIFPSGSSGGWRTPGDDRPLLSTGVDPSGDHAVIVRPGADVGGLVALLAALPCDAFFTEHFGDVEVVLLFHPVPGLPATADSTPTPPAGPAAAGPTGR